MRNSAPLLRSAALFVGALLGALACGRPAGDDAVVALLEPSSDRGGALELPPVDLDLRLPDALERVLVEHLEVRPGAEGLELFVRGAAPQLMLAEPAVAARAVAVEIRSAAAGTLALAWAGGGAPLAPADLPFAPVAEPVPLAPAGAFAWYRFELPSAASAAPGGALLRFELRGWAESGRGTRSAAVPPALTLRAVRFETAPDTVAPVSTPVEGRLRAGRELRLAAAVASGSRLVFPLPPDARQLTFGVARRPDGAARCALEVVLTAAEHGRRVALTTELDRGHALRWSDYSVTLARSRTSRELAFEPRCPERESGHGWAGALFVGTPEIRVARPARGPDIVLVSLDTVSGAVFDEALAAGRAPAFARLAQRGVRFRRARANSSVTPTSHAVMLSGRLPAEAGVFWAKNGRTAGPTLAELLGAAGYTTTAITGGVLVHERFGHDRGFDSFSREDSLYRIALETQSDIRAVAALAEERMARRGGGPRFLFVHTYEAHSPYLRRAPLEPHPDWHALRLASVPGRLPFARDRLGELVETADANGRWRPPRDLASAEAALALARATYLAELERIDRELGPPLERFLDRAGARGAVLAVTSDHGEAFFEHGLVQHELLEESNLRVPLLLVAPGLPAGAERDYAASTVDLMPTLLELAGVALPRELDGRSLVAAARGRSGPAPASYALTAHHGFAWWAGDEKWVTPTLVVNENFGHEALYDLAVDAGETTDRLAAGARPSATLAALARATWDLLPGLHLDLSSLAGRELEIDLALRSGAELHAWDLRPVATTGESALRRVRVGPSARLLWLDVEVGAGAVLELGDPSSGARCRLLRVTPSPDDAPFALEACRGALGAPLRAWRRAASVPLDARDGPTAAELEQLRALGYLR